MDNTSESSHSSPDAALLQTQQTRKSVRAERPCDICRKRKSRCAKEPDQERCVLCTFHGRECTYLDAPQPRNKKRVDIHDETTISIDGTESDIR